jgi:N-acyl-D-aspartate/D-glutamate deacylase
MLGPPGTRRLNLVKRRQLLGMVVPLLAGRWARSGEPRLARALPPDLTLVLRGGRWFARGAWQTGDIGIDAGGRLRFGSDLRAPELLDITGRVVSPGFIDVLADNGANPTRTFPIFEKYKVSDGVTTALQMHGGSADSAAFYAALGARSHSINYGVSTFVIAIRGRAGDLRERKRQVERNLEEGALGVSHSLEYQPTPYSEVLEYAKIAKHYERPLFLHLRYSSAANELAGVAEAVRLAQDSGARVHIDHLHSTGGTFHMEGALKHIHGAIAQGLRLTTCVYPYSYWATYLHSRRFDPGWEQRYGLTYADLRVVGTGERLTAASFARYRKTVTLVAVPEGTMPLDRTLDLALREDFCMIASDGGIQYEPRANSHPRGAGCFAAAIRHALDLGMPLETILDKMTALPRSVVLPALRERGVLEEGAVADLTVLDPVTIRGNATLDNPNQFSSGIELVTVSGKVAYRNGRLAARNGAAVRYASSALPLRAEQ